MSITIAIDGPVGAGKSTVADDVAARLNILHLDTGAMYRALAYYALKEGVGVEDEPALCALADAEMPEVRFIDGKQRTYIGGEDVTGLIRTPEVSMAASTISKIAGVRQAMVRAQRALAAKQSILLDGRDIGTVVLPHATLKIYLTATPEARARRRFDEMQSRGDTTPYEDVLADVIRRDKQDMTREVDPLRPAEDAQILDTSAITQQQAVEEIVRRLNMKLGRKPKPEEKIPILYKIAQWIAAFLFNIVMPIKYHFVENAQLDAPYILISNHQTMLDPMIVAWKCYRYHMIFLGKRELEKNPILKLMFRKLNMIAVDRHNMDMAAMRACLKALKDGHPLGIFPEGTRHKHGIMEELESGIAMMALRSGARVLPVYVQSKPKLFRRTHVYYGQPISFTELAEGGVNKEACDKVLERITQTYRDMVSKYGA